jgi:2-polyprenyl-3-methyl-5-hydroxy-6-metoxy-1,4-benzoquinol methylase
VTAPAACPDCAGTRLRSLGRLPDVAVFAGRTLPAPLAGGELLHCRSCDLRFRHPRLPPAGYDALYDNSEAGAWSAGPLRRDQQLVRDVLVQALGGRPAGARVLDFGCYTGALLALPAGLERLGVEVNRVAAGIAVQRAGADVRARLQDFDGEPPFDAIVAIDVIEHMPSPREFLALLLARLADDGLLVLTTGDGGSLLWRLLGARWWYCFYPEHISFISRRWLERHAAPLDARVRRCERFNYLDETPRQRWRRWPAMISHALSESRADRRRARRLARGDVDTGVPGIGLTRDHLIVMLTR